MHTLSTLQIDDFKPLLNQRFSLSGGPLGDESFEMQLMEAKTTQDGPIGNSTRTPFCLLFHVAMNDDITHATYNISNDQTGIIEGIYLVPVALEDGFLHLEAIFN